MVLEHPREIQGAALRAVRVGVSDDGVREDSEVQTARRTSENSGVLKRPPAHLHFADDVLLRHGTPMAAVGAVVPVVAHHEVVALLDYLRTPVVVAAELGGDLVSV